MAQSFTEIEEEFYRSEAQRFEALLPFLEADVRAFKGLDQAAMASIAVSLKRIADFFCGTSSSEDVVAYLMKAYIGERK